MKAIIAGIVAATAIAGGPFAPTASAATGLDYDLNSADNAVFVSAIATGLSWYEGSSRLTFTTDVDPGLGFSSTHLTTTPSGSVIYIDSGDMGELRTESGSSDAPIVDIAFLAAMAQNPTGSVADFAKEAGKADAWLSITNQVPLADANGDGFGYWVTQFDPGVRDAVQQAFAEGQREQLSAAQDAAQ